MVERETDRRARRLVQLSLPFVEYLALGYVARRPNEAALVGKVSDFLDGVGNYVGLPPSGKREKLRRLAQIGRAAGNAATRVVAGMIAWCGAMLLVAIFLPSVTFELTMVSFVALLALTVLGAASMTRNVERNEGGQENVEARPAIVQRLVLLILSGSLGVLGIAYGMFLAMMVDHEAAPAMLSSYQEIISLEPFNFAAAVLCMVFLIIWNHVALAVLQEATSGASYVGRVIKRFVTNEAEVTAVSDALKKNVIFTKVGNSVLVATATVIVLVITAWLIGLGPVERGVVAFVAGLLAIVRSNVWAMAVRKYPNLAKRHEEITKDDGDKAARAVYLVPVTILILMAVLGALGVNRVIALKERIGHVSAKAVEAVDEQIGYTSGSSATPASADAPTNPKCAKLRPDSLKIMRERGTCP